MLSGGDISSGSGGPFLLRVGACPSGSGEADRPPRVGVHPWGRTRRSSLPRVGRDCSLQLSRASRYSAWPWAVPGLMGRCQSLRPYLDIRL